MEAISAYNQVSNSLLELDPASRNRQDAELSPKQEELRTACRDFEAVLSSIIMKEGLRTAKETLGPDDDHDKGSETFNEIANEQIAYFMGRQGMMGLGDSLYNSLKDRLQESVK